MKKLFTLFFLLFTFPAMAIETTAKHAFLMDATTGAVLFNKDGDTQMVPSSMSKLMTAYVTFTRLKEGRLKLEDTLTVSEKAWRMQGSKTFVAINSQVSVDDLLHGVIVQSGNDACIVLAEGISGSEEAFVAEMNAAAKKLGLANSNFVNATGWPDEGHLMSAHDLAVLTQAIINEFPEYHKFYSIKEFTYNNITQHNRNRLLGNDIGVDGMKTGHTDAAGYGIVLSAAHEGRRLILVINGLESDNARIKEGDTLLRYGFREFTNRTLVNAGATIGQAKMWMGTEKTVPLVAEKDVVITVPAGHVDNATYKLRYDGPIAAPIKKGDRIAQLVIINGTREQLVPLVAGADVEKLSGLSKTLFNLKSLVGIH